jgi:hypothetical protein
MTDLEIKKISAGWLALVVPVIGAGIFYLWQPITDYFVAGAFDENEVLLIDAETVKSDTKNPLLVIHVKASYRGNVPVTIKTDGGIGQIALQVRRIENPTEAKWIDPEILPLIAETNSLRHHNGGYVIAPNAFYEEIEGIALPSGTYWIKGSIIFENGEYIDQTAIVSHVQK